jgi:hypothetical protein
MANGTKFNRWVALPPGLNRDCFQNVFQRLDDLDTHGVGAVPPDGGVTTDKLADKAATEPKLDDGAASSRVIRDGAVGTGKLDGTAGALLQGAPTFTIGAEAADVIAVAIQLKDAKGQALPAAHVAQAWLSDAAGGAATATSPSGAVAAGANGLVVRELSPKVHLVLATNGAGQVDLSITHTGARTWYLNLEWGGRLYSSGPISFA